MRATVTAAFALLALPGTAAGQIPSTRPAAREIVSAVVAQGHLGGWYSYIDFAGCPQRDPTGAAVLDLMASQADLSDAIVSGLVRLWSDEFHVCDYEPLDAWYFRAVDDLLGRGGLFAQLALDNLPPSPRADLDARLRAFVMDPSGAPRTRSDVGNLVLDRLTATDQRDAFLTFAGSEGLPGEWISSWSGYFTRVEGSRYVVELALRAGSIDDDTLGAAIGTVLTGVSLGTLPATDPSMLALAHAVAGRPGLGELHRVLLLTIDPSRE